MSYSRCDRLELLEGQSDVVCVSCDAEDTSDSVPCQFVDAQFSPSSMFYVDACLGPHPPRYVLKSAVDDLQRIHLYFAQIHLSQQ